MKVQSTQMYNMYNSVLGNGKKTLQ